MKFVLPPGKWRNTRISSNPVITSDGKITTHINHSGSISKIPANRWGPFGWYRIGVKAYYEKVNSNSSAS
jgi:hypothetical protein